MIHSRYRHAATRGRLTKRRLSCLVAAAALVLATGCDDDDTTGPGEPVTGTFVGEVAGADPVTLVAVHAADPDPAGQREVTVYVCDATLFRYTLWFKGPVTGNSFTLTSASGEATAQVSLTENGASGTITYGAAYGNERLEFAAGRAGGVAGLYFLTITPDGRFTGTEIGGEKRLEGGYSGFTSGATYPITVFLPDGSEVQWNGRAELTGSPAIEARLILHADYLGIGDQHATTAKRTELAEESKYIHWDIDF